MTELEWEVAVDFEKSVLSGTAKYKVKFNNQAATVLCLDTNNLVIRGVTSGGSPLQYKIHPEYKDLGRKLEINVASLGGGEAGGQSAHSISIQYSTTKKSAALQWLPPSQTSGKQYPYLFTQAQAIHARSLVPCQDRPGVKMTYRATVTVPSWATCVASALQDKPPTTTSSSKEGSTATFYWNQPVAVSSYLIALAVGRLEKVDLSPQVAIWSEPSVIKAAAWEFAQTPEFLQIATEIAGCDYVWERYDLLCLPPSFPYGGMENPCLTFVTPTLLAGDRSLADVVAHEIAHSWTGNLVTNATWEHFWLNEGWTTWFQRKIMAAIHKNPLFVDFDAIGRYKGLEQTCATMKDDFTRLVPILGDQDPDDYYSLVPYEKGFNFLFYLEGLVGSDAFLKFFQAYLKEFSHKTLTSDDFKTFFIAHFSQSQEQQYASVLAKIDWDTWYYKPGMPPVEPKFDRSLASASDQLAKEWLRIDDKNKSGDSGDDDSMPKTDVSGWTSNQMTCFLDGLKGMKLQLTTLKALDNAYGFSKSKNSEILFLYCQLALLSKDESIVDVVVRFATTQGRMKFTRPLYRSLFEFDADVAVDTFLKHRDTYHPICAKMVAQDLKVGGGGGGVNKASEDDDGNDKRKKNLIWYGGAVVGAAVLGAVAFTMLRRKR